MHLLLPPPVCANILRKFGVGRVVVKEVAVPIERIVENVITKEVIFARNHASARKQAHTQSTYPQERVSMGGV